MAASILTYAGYSSLMAGALASFAGGANNARLRLFKNNFFPTKSTLWTELEECDFAGYAAQVPTLATDQGLTAAFVDVWRFLPVNFTMVALPIQPAYGFWLDFNHPITAVRTLTWIKRFDSPFLFTGPGSTLPVTLYPGFSQG